MSRSESKHCDKQDNEEGQSNEDNARVLAHDDPRQLKSGDQS
jgi:hypothetical protein